MYIISTFEHTMSLEIMLKKLDKKGLSIVAVPLDTRMNKKNFFDTIHRSDGVSLLDFAFILATMGMVIGLIYGFILTWGPVIWGLLGSAAGFLTGLIISLVINYKNKRSKYPNKAGEVVVIIECEDIHLEAISEILWEHDAIGVSKATR
jgi:hypothetical protein